MTWDKRFPFTPDGSLLGYEGYGSPDVVRRTLEEARFTGTLSYLTYSRGRSSALLEFTDGTRSFSFFMTDADELIPLLVHGKITGTFIPSKRGQNYAWKLER